MRIFIIFAVCLLIASNVGASTINVVDQDDGLTPSCDNGTNHNGVEETELIPALEAANWTGTNGWSAGSGTIVKTGASSGTMQPITPITITAGKRYQVVISANVDSGANITVSLGGTACTELSWYFGNTATFISTIVAANTNNLILTGTTGTTIGAVSVKRLHDDVQAAVNSASASPAGDIIVIPSGTCTWTSPVTASKEVKLTGTGCTLDANGVPSSCQTNITCTGATVGMPRCVTTAGTGGNNVDISNVSWTQAEVANKSMGATYFEGINWRVHHNMFSSVTFGQSVLVIGMIRGTYPKGLIDHNHFSNQNIVVGYAGSNTTVYDYADVLWSQDPGMGGSEAIYVEDNTSTNSVLGDIVDGDYGFRIVYRFNRLTNTGTGGNGFWIAVHSNNGYRGAQRWEVYGNIIDGGTTGTYYPMNFRAGTGVSFNNTVKGTWGNYIIDLDNFRNINSDCSSNGNCCTGDKPDDENTAGQEGWHCRDQVGLGKDASLWCNGQSTYPSSCGSMGAWNQVIMPVYAWNNGPQDTCATSGSCDNSLLFAASGMDLGNIIQADREFYNYNGSCTGGAGCATGIGVGTSFPTSCNLGTGFWRTDLGSWNKSGSGGQGQLYKCTTASPAAWTLYYTPYKYPYLSSDITSVGMVCKGCVMH